MVEFVGPRAAKRKVRESALESRIKQGKADPISAEEYDLVAYLESLAKSEPLRIDRAG